MKGLFRQKRRLGKRGIMAFNFLAMVPRIIFLVVMLIACVVLISMFLNNKFDTTDIQAEVLINGLIYGGGGIGYYDPVIARMYPQIIDLAQLESEALDMGLYYPDNNLITAKITVESADEQLPIKTVYYNKEWYENWEPLLKWKDLKGIGGVVDYEKRLPVMVRDEDGNLKAAYVNFHVVQPKSARVKK
ncbi:hypothetical protein ACFL3V_07170 [Nanoarchaeota archaeon]